MKGLSIIASGLVTAVGFNSISTLAALRAGISGIRETHLADRQSGEALRGAKVDLPHWWEGLGKVVDLAAPPIDECLYAAQFEKPENIPILLGVAAPDRPGRWEGLDTQLLKQVERKLDLPHHPESRTFPMGQTAGIYGMVFAHDILTKRKARCCIIAGADSYLQQETVDAYVAQRRIMTEDNSNGFFPGEAGAAVLVTLGGQEKDPHLQIRGLGVADELAPIASEEPFRGEGMTEAVKLALKDANLKMEDLAWSLTDITGEHYKFKEAGFATGRLSSGTRQGIFDIWHPIEYLGEIGAAMVPTLLAWALHAGQKDYAPGARALCHVGNDAHERAAWITEFSAGGKR